jgi:hypothetical protein
MTMADKKTRLPGELTFTVLLLLGSLFLLYQAYGISGFESITSAGMFPMLSALVMAFTAFLAILLALTLTLLSQTPLWKRVKRKA